MDDLTFLLAGPTRHGVRVHAKNLVCHTPGGQSVNIEDGSLPARTTGRVHLHFTDRIFGSNAEEAAERVCEIVGDRPMTVTLHDLPQASDGPAFQRRQCGYVQVVARARGVQVSSEHESDLLLQAWQAVGSGRMPPVTVVPLPVDRPVRWGPSEGFGESSAVVVLGFLYPGKGHAETLDAMRLLPTTVPLIAVGAVSDGHDDLLVELSRGAAAQRRSFECTGYVTEDLLGRWVAGAAVPVSAHTHISASGSINRWISGGRRPIVTPGRYVEELARRAPWAMNVTTDLPAAIAAALQDPASTWIQASEWDDEALPDTARTAALQLAAIDALDQG